MSGVQLYINISPSRKQKLKEEWFYSISMKIHTIIGIYEKTIHPTRYTTYKEKPFVINFHRKIKSISYLIQLFENNLWRRLQSAKKLQQCECGVQKAIDSADFLLLFQAYL